MHLRVRDVWIETQFHTQFEAANIFEGVYDSWKTNSLRFTTPS